MVKRIFCTCLEPCHSTQGEWQWTESEQIEEDGQGYDGDISQFLEDNILDWNDVTISEKFNGRIHWLKDGIILADKEETHPIEMYWVEESPAKISVNNGNSYYGAEEIDEDFLANISWGSIVSSMDNEAREEVHRELAPCSNMEFLKRYLEVATCDLCIG